MSLFYTVQCDCTPRIYSNILATICRKSLSVDKIEHATFGRTFSLWVKLTVIDISIVVISINWTVSSFCRSPIRFDLCGNIKDTQDFVCRIIEWKLMAACFVSYYWLSLAPSVVSYGKKDLNFASFSFGQKNRLSLRGKVYGFTSLKKKCFVCKDTPVLTCRQTDKETETGSVHERPNKSVSQKIRLHQKGSPL